MRNFFRSSPKNGVNLKMFRQKSHDSTNHLTVLKSIIANIPDFIHYISCLGVELTRFPYQEECVNEWFKLTEEDDEGKRVFQVININWINRNETIPPQSDVKFPLGLLESGYKILFHGTNHDAAKSIVEGGILLKKGAANQDFSSDKGFYLGENFEEALVWACHRFPNHPAVVIFRIRMETLEQYEGLDLKGNLKKGDWNEIVSNFRSGAKNKKLSRRIYKNNDFIEGPMASVSKKRGISNYLKQKEDSYQLCILSEKLAEEFDTCLHSVVFYAI